MVPFTPRLVAAILPNLAHHVPMIQSAALRTNQLLSNVIQNLPPPGPPTQQQQSADKASIASSRTGPPATSPPPSASPVPSRQSTMSAARDSAPPDSLPDVNASPASDKTARHRSATVPPPADFTYNGPGFDSDLGPQSQASRSHSPTSTASVPVPGAVQPSPQVVPLEMDPFDYHETVNMLTIQFLSEHQETRVAALKWLIMLHQKAPKKVSRPFVA